MINLENFKNYVACQKLKSLYDEVNKYNIPINQTNLNQTNPTSWLTIIEGYVIFFILFFVIPN